jgi:hypothetical protein
MSVLRHDGVLEVCLFATAKISTRQNFHAAAHGRLTITDCRALAQSCWRAGARRGFGAAALNRRVAAMLCQGSARRAAACVPASREA